MAGYKLIVENQKCDVSSPRCARRIKVSSQVCPPLTALSYTHSSFLHLLPFLFMPNIYF